MWGFRLLFVLLLPFILGVRGQCPAQCRCPSSHVANCASLALTSVPSDRFDRYVQNLDISDNVISSLDKTSLRHMGVISLVQLNASRNDINDIHEQAFLGQSKLQTVDLSSNKLTSIEPWTFMRNPFLERLSLSNNQLLRLPEEDSFLYSISLQVLYLSSCNISHIPPKTFQNLPNLKELYISHNKIEVLSPLQNVGRMTFLDISYNYLTDLQSDIFTASPELIRLNLSDNRFSTLNITVMPYVANIHNTINLKGNPWECDCVMFDTVYSWCRNNSVDLELVCSSPPKFKDKPWEVCENVGCGSDDTDFAEKVEVTIMMDQKVSPGRENANYESPNDIKSFDAKFQEENIEYKFTYMYVSLALLLVLLCLLTSMVILWYCSKSRPSMRTGPAQIDSEAFHLSDTET